MNAIQNFLKSFAIGYAVSYIATTLSETAKADEQAAGGQDAPSAQKTRVDETGYIWPVE